MTRTFQIASAICAALAFSLPACAQDQSRSQQDKGQAAGAGATASRGVPLQQNQSRQQLFDKLDANKSGSISRAEAQPEPALVVIFVETDANGDGEISVAEFAAVPLTNPDGSAAK